MTLRLYSCLLSFLCFLCISSHIVAIQSPDATVMIPMRDDVELPTSLYFPNNVPGKYPCVLIRSPLGREHADPAWLKLTDAGYVVAVQSTRSSCDETGRTLPYLTDGWGVLADGYDTIEWLASSEWTDGKIATVGTSASGITQFLLAPSAPPHLVCQYIELAAPSLYQYAVWPGGQFRKEQVEGWLKAHKRDPSLVNWLHKKSAYDSFWGRFNAVDLIDRISAPQLHLGGWYDIFSQGTLDAFIAAQENSPEALRDQHKLIMGPWGHQFRKSTQLGEFNALAFEKSMPFPISVKEWVDFHVKGEKNIVAEAPPIQYFVMGPLDGSPSSGNEWRTAHKWPPDHLAYVQMYLQPEKLLALENSEIDDSIIDLLFDPDHPVPTLGGRNLFIADGPRDLRPIEKRSDVLTFTSDTLSKDTEVTGRVYACLFISHLQQERDICIRLSDVYPDGKSVLVCEGVSHISPKDIELSSADAARPVIVDLWTTSMVFAKNHKIRTSISGSNFPAYDTSLALNIVEDESTQENLCYKIHLGGKLASYIALPLAKNEEVQPTAEHTS